MTVNEISQDDNINSTFARFLSGMEGHLKKISRNTLRDKVQFDEFLYESGVSGEVALEAKLIGPVIITDVIAAWSNSPSASITQGGNAIAPAGPGTIIATWAVAESGNYVITVQNQVSGAVAADRNNMGLYAGNELIATLPVVTAGTAEVSSTPTIVSLAAGEIVTVQQINATTSTDYYAIITATLQESPETVTLTIGDRIIPLPPSDGCFILSLTSGMQLDSNTAHINLITNPPSPCFLEIQGYGSNRKMQ